MDNESKLFIWRETGADPEIVVRGIQLSKTFDKQAKKKRKKKKEEKEERKKTGEGLWWFFPSFWSIVYIDFPYNYLHTSLFSVRHGLLYNCKPSLRKHTDHMVNLIKI